MKQYEIIEGKKYSLKGTTARVEQELAELGITSDFVEVDDSPESKDKDPDVALQKILQEGGDKLIRLCNAIFRQPDFKKEDALDIDKSVVREAMMDFFMRDLVTIAKYSDFLQTSILPK